MDGSTPLRVLHRDEHLVAIDKPAGLLVHRTELEPRATVAAVQLLRDQIGQPVYPAHRLDRPTSGVLLFALDPPTAQLLATAFAERRVRKLYRTVVRGHPAVEGRVDHPLAPRPGRPPVPAITRWRRLATAELPVRVDRYPTSRYALLELEPLTGRFHQLRRHLHHLSHPIIGDTVHGKARHNRLFAERFGATGLLLSCVALELVHPVSGAPLRLMAAPHAGIVRAMQALGWEDPSIA